MGDEKGVVELSSDEWDQFYGNQGSQYFQLESSIIKAHAEDQKKLLYEIFGSNKILVQTIGVVAGFGFTGLGYVRNLTLFIGGEAFLFVGIFAGLYWAQKVYRYNFESSSTEITWTKKLFARRYATFKKIYDKAMSDIENGGGNGDEVKMSIPESQMLDLKKANNDLMEEFTARRDENRLSDPFGRLMVFFAIGGSLLLLSFINTWWLWKILL